ncbi:MAG TPA: acyl-CoA dehydrogenase [Spirochaetota bacterium]|nr:acyl-CoA dehydrogenase [Spirochaetota bacterium]HPI87769.1 acyl-CoA dehydrogenase [Spirochaetota bacterium]HPR47055.1 acyl-CoA dehydrogenase [Spirochaetota bacterium]
MEALIEQNILMNLAFMNLSFEEVNHFENLARDFSKRSIGPMFENDLPDGDLSHLEKIIEKAFDIGIAASAHDKMAGNEFGIWGNCTDSSGLLTSLVLLSAIAESCGGIAMGLHSHGVAVNILQKAAHKMTKTFSRPIPCFQDDFGVPSLKTIMSPDLDMPQKMKTEAVEAGPGYVLNGSKHFTYSLPGADALVVLARLENSWCCLAVPADSPGVTITDAGRRTGLRASKLNHVTFNNVTVPRENRIDENGARPLVIRSLCLDWVGMCAIAVGIARGAVKAAKQYAAERYQGGAQIEDHPVIRMLLAGSETRARTAKATVLYLKDMDPEKLTSLRAAAMAKLSVMEVCAQAVTDSLQVFGGYGYMEDFGMEKRLRDVTVLKSAHGSPLYLKQLICDIDREEAR